MNVSTKEVWDDVAGIAFGDADQDCVNDAFEHGAVTVQYYSHLGYLVSPRLSRVVLFIQ
jgi:hypothetical protein